MIPHFDYINFPYGMRLLLKQYLKNAATSEQFIASVLAKDSGLKTLIIRQLSPTVKDTSIVSMVRLLGWDFFRRSILSHYLHKEEHGIWPAVTPQRPSVDLALMTTDEWLGQYSVKGHFRHTMLVFYLRVLELRLGVKDKKTVPLLASLMQQLELLGRPKRPMEQGDLLVLILWHFVEYFHPKELTEFLRAGKKFQELFDQLGPNYQKVMLFNISQYLLSIGDGEAFTWKMVS